MALDATILDTRRATVGTGGFDLSQVLGLGGVANGFAPNGNNEQQDFATMQDQIFSEQDQALINDINEMINELQANMSSGAGNELESMISRIAGRLLQAGLPSAAANALMLEVERRDRADGSTFSNEDWRRIQDEVKKEREEKAKIADMADDMANASRPMTEQEWDEGSHDVAGMKMTGVQIDNVIQFMRDPRARQRLIQQRAAQLGGDTQRAEQEINMTLAYLEAKKRIDRGQGTDEDRDLVRRVDESPQLKAIIRQNVNAVNTMNSEFSNGGVRVSENNGSDPVVSGNGLSRVNSRIGSLNTVTTPVYRTLDQENGETPALSARGPFNQSANPDFIPAPEVITPQPGPLRNATLASTTPVNLPGLDQGAGML